MFNADQQQLDAAEGEATESSTARPSGQAGALNFIFLLVTDARITQKQTQQHRILSMCGHFLANRIVIVSKEVHEGVYGRVMCNKHVLAEFLLRLQTILRHLMPEMVAQPCFAADTVIKPCNDLLLDTSSTLKLRGI